MTPRSVLLFNIGQLLTLRSGAEGPRRGRELADLGLVKNGAVLCDGGKILSAGSEKEVLKHSSRKKLKKIQEFDCGGKVVLPGFVDSHTHLIFAAPRLVDFEKRIAGASYEEIAAAGGGIRSSVEGVRKASKAALAAGALKALQEMARQGTTTVEAKSGYGLEYKAEIKSLEAIQEAAKQWPGTVVPTFLGAHVVPRELKDRPDAYVKEVTEKMLPAVAKRNLARFVDVFCDRGAFTVEQTERIFSAARDHGLPVRAHVCQLAASNLWPFFAFRPASLDHMDHVLEDEIPQLAQRDTVATLVPGANYFLGMEEYPPARKLIDAGVPVALATDYNPGSSPTSSMPFVLSLACTQMKMSPAEAIAAGTINGAHSLLLANRKGSIETGKDADLAVFNAEDYREIAYWFASNHCSATILNGILQTHA